MNQGQFEKFTMETQSGGAATKVMNGHKKAQEA
jgi:hypothetical protein